MPQASPIRSAPRRRDRGAVLWLALAATIPVGAALAGSSLEYGPEAEARFLETCAASSGPADCRRLSERLQGALGYEAFLDRAHGGPEAFAGLTAVRCLVADALRHAEPACEAGTMLVAR